MNPSSLIPILLDEFYDKLTHLSSMVTREVVFPDAPSKIKVAIGMRRVGKTYFLYQQILELLKKKVDRKQILYLNFEDDRLLPLDSIKLAGLIEAFYSLFPQNHNKKCYLFLDEIQSVPDWHLVIRRFHDTKNVEIFLTGSSAKLLSKEIATSLRGRSLSTEIWPFSFQEYMIANKLSIDRSLFSKKTEDHLSQIFQSYLACGGFPEVTFYPPDVRRATLQEYIDVVIYRDIIERHKITQPALLKHMILSMIHNVGTPFAIYKFYHESKSRGYQVGKDLLYQYTDWIEDAYLTFLIPLFDPSLRKVQTTPKKLYCIDPGLVRAETLDYEQKLGRLFENIFYLDLKRMGCEVSYYLTEERHEIDFVVKTPSGSKKLFQVVWDTQDQKTLDREKRAMDEGMKELKITGELVTLKSYLQNGIQLD